MARLCDLVVLFCCALCAWSSLRVSCARADAQQPLQVVVRVVDPADQAWVPRIRGQISDLPVQLELSSSAPLEPRLRDQLATARALARLGAARVVVWVARSAERSTLVVADLELDRVLVRELPAGDSERDRSAQDEAAALVVRSALKASLAGQPLGRAQVELEPEPVPVSAPSPTPIAGLEPASPAAPPSQPATLRGALALGALAGIDGATNHGNDGLSARAALRVGRWESGLRGSFGVRAPVAGSPVELQLAQHRLTGYAGWAALSTRELRVTLAGAAGVVVFHTRVRGGPDAFQASRARGALMVLGAGAWLAYTPRFARGRVGLAWSAFAEAFPERLSLGYRQGAGFVRVARAWPVQPVFTMELVLPLGGG